MIINSNMTSNAPLHSPRAKHHKQISENDTKVGAAQVRTTAQVTSHKNLTAAASPIQDEDAATQSTESARQMIIAQNAMALLAQANSMPQSALRLLQQ